MIFGKKQRQVERQVERKLASGLNLGSVWLDEKLVPLTRLWLENGRLQYEGCVPQPVEDFSFSTLSFMDAGGSVVLAVNQGLRFYEGGRRLFVRGEIILDVR